MPAFTVSEVETLRGIARELVETVRSNVKTEWALRETVRAQYHVLIKRILRRHGYPPDKQAKATQNVLEQSDVSSAEWRRYDPSADRPENQQEEGC